MPVVLSTIQCHTRHKESRKLQKSEDDQSVILTACVSRNRELQTCAIIPILNNNNQFPKYAGTSSLYLKLCWLPPSLNSEVTLHTVESRKRLLRKRKSSGMPFSSPEPPFLFRRVALGTRISCVLRFYEPMFSG